MNFVNRNGITTLTYGGLKAWDAAGRALLTRFISRTAGITVEVDDHNATYPVTIDPVAQQAYLKASNTEAEKRFGWSVAISDDTVVVGTYGSAPNSGAAYVFFRNEEDTWSEQAYLQATNPTEGDFFGHSVAVSGDTMVAGAHGEASNAGAAYVFSRSVTIWSFQDYLQASNAGADDRFGWAVGVSDDIVVVGAYGESSNAGASTFSPPNLPPPHLPL